MARRAAKRCVTDVRQLGHVREPRSRKRRHPHLDHVDPVDRGPRGSGPPATSSPRSRWVADRMRTSTGCSRWSPTGRTVFSWIRRSSFTCMTKRQVRDLVEEQRAALGGLHQAQLVGDGAGEAAAAVAEELALHELGRNRAAVDRHERRVLARPGFVDEPRDELLAGAGLAGDVHGRLAARDRPIIARSFCIGSESPSRRRAAVARRAGCPRASAPVDELAQVDMSTGLRTKSKAPSFSARTAASTLAVRRDHGDRRSGTSRWIHSIELECRRRPAGAGR